MGREASKGRRCHDQGPVSPCHQGPALAALPPEIWPQFLRKKQMFPCRPGWLRSGHQTLPSRRLWLPSAIRAPGLVLRCPLAASCLVLCVCLYRGGAGSSSLGRCLSLPMVGEGRNPPGAAARPQPTASPACVYRNKRLLARPGRFVSMAGGVWGCPALLGGISRGGARFWHRVAGRGSSGRASTGTWGG